MNTFQTAENFPFASAALRAAWPSLDMEGFLELHRKNAVALTNASQAAFDGLSALAQRQGDLVKSTVDEFSRVVSDTLATGPLEERVRKQTDAGRHLYDSSAAGFRDLCDIATKANVATVGILSTRVTEALREFTALLAASPVEGATATSAASTPVIAGPAAGDEERTPGSSADAVEPEPNGEAAQASAIAEPAVEIEGLGRDGDADAAEAPDEPKPARKATPRTPRTTGSPGAKASRRPPSRR